MFTPDELPGLRQTGESQAAYEQRSGHAEAVRETNGGLLGSLHDQARASLSGVATADDRQATAEWQSAQATTVDYGRAR
jgi:hypothetical protein